MAKTKLSVTVQECVAEQIQELAVERSLPVSQIVEAALRQFLESEREGEMVEGYAVMAEFDRALAEADMTAGFEALPNA